MQAGISNGFEIAVTITYVCGVPSGLLQNCPRPYGQVTLAPKPRAPNN